MSSNISKNHKKYFLKIHLILVCKYRKKLLIGQIENEIKKYIIEICSQSNFVIDIMETDKDHIHLLLDITPNYSISSIVNRLKAMSTNRIWKHKNNIYKNIFGMKKHFGVMDTSFLQLEMQVRKL